MLPKVNSPTFETKLVSIDEPVRYRPFTVKEEKILLIAEESKEEKEILYAIRQILNNCLISDIAIDRLPLFDLQYLFLQIRAKSVNNVSMVKYKDKEDQEVREFEINFDKIKPQVDPNHSNTIKLSSDLTIIFKYPTIETLNKLESLQADDVEVSIEMLAECLDKIIETDNVFVADTYTSEEKITFIESLPIQHFETIVDDFLISMPKMIYTIEYVNNNGKTRQIVLEGLRSFFP